MAEGKKPLVPQGPLGGYRKPGDDRFEGKWIGDRSNSIQVKKFEEGEDYLFFQGPAPSSAVQEDLPDFFSKVCVVGRLSCGLLVTHNPCHQNAPAGKRG